MPAGLALITVASLQEGHGELPELQLIPRWQNSLPLEAFRVEAIALYTTEVLPHALPPSGSTPFFGNFPTQS